MLPGAAAFSRGYLPFICAFIVVVLLFEFCNFYQFRNPSHLVPPSSIGLGRISHQFDEVRDFAGAANSTLGVSVPVPKRNIGTDRLSSKHFSQSLPINHWVAKQYGDKKA